MARSLANSMGLGGEGSLKGSLRGGFGLRGLGLRTLGSHSCGVWDLRLRVFMVSDGLGFRLLAFTIQVPSSAVLS